MILMTLRQLISFRWGPNVNDLYTCEGVDKSKAGTSAWIRWVFWERSACLISLWITQRCDGQFGVSYYVSCNIYSLMFSPFILTWLYRFFFTLLLPLGTINHGWPCASLQCHLRSRNVWRPWVFIALHLSESNQTDPEMKEQTAAIIYFFFVPLIFCVVVNSVRFYKYG